MESWGLFLLDLPSALFRGKGGGREGRKLFAFCLPSRCRERLTFW